MPTFEAGTIVRVPFSCTDRSTRQRRPALVVSTGPVGRAGMLLWVVMITSAENAGWPDDVAIPDDRNTTGLPISSIVRAAKIATIDPQDSEPIGHVPRAVQDAVAQVLQRQLGVPSDD